MLNYIASAIEKSKNEEKFNIQISEPSMIVTTDVPPEAINFDPLEKLTEIRHYNIAKTKRQIVSFLITYDPLSTKNPEKSTVIPLSQKSKSLTRIFGSHSGANRALKMLQHIGLISIVSTKYRYNSNNNIAMTYRYNHFVAEILKNALKDVEPYIHPKRKWKKNTRRQIGKIQSKSRQQQNPLGQI